MQTRRRGGTSDTEVNAVAVSPHGCRSTVRVVTTVTPAAKLPMTFRKRVSSIAMRAPSAQGRAQGSRCAPAERGGNPGERPYKTAAAASQAQSAQDRAVRAGAAVMRRGIRKAHRQVKSF